VNTPVISVRRTSTPLLWKTVNKTFLLYESCYKRLQKLQPIDDFMYLKKSRYAGNTRIFSDGTVLNNGDTIGIIHFNNNYLARVYVDGGKNGRRAAFVFGYALIRSMQNLALELKQNPSLQELSVINGITWFKPHGNKVGFESEPLPEGRRKWLLKNHFRLLLYALFPHLAKRENARLEPHCFWLTKNRLIESITANDNHVAQRLSKNNQPRIAT
jgi:hypothetical protein